MKVACYSIGTLTRLGTSHEVLLDMVSILDANLSLEPRPCPI